MRRRSRFVAIAAAVLLLGTACSGGTKDEAQQAPPSSAPDGKALVVGAFNFTESQILANVFADVLTDAGVPASVRTLTTREVIEPALRRGSVQVVPEYTASLAAFMGVPGHPSAAGTSRNLAGTVAALRAQAPKHHVEVLNPSRAADQNAFAVTKQFAEANRLTKLSDLALYGGPLVLGGPTECRTRPYCKPGLEQTYDIHFDGFVPLDPGGPLTKLALKTGHVQLGLVFSSDPGIDAYNLTVLADDKHLQDVDVVVPVVHQAAATPAVVSALNKLMASLTTNDLRRLNAAVELSHEDPSTVAREYVSGLAHD